MIMLIVFTAIFTICALCCCKKYTLEQSGPGGPMKQSIDKNPRANYYSGVSNGQNALNRESLVSSNRITGGSE